MFSQETVFIRPKIVKTLRTRRPLAPPSAYARFLRDFYSQQRDQLVAGTVANNVQKISEAWRNVPVERKQVVSVDCEYYIIRYLLFNAGTGGTIPKGTCRIP